MELISIGLMVAIIIAAGAWAKVYMAKHGVSKHGIGRYVVTQQQPLPQANPVTTKALETYERLANEKLEVIKTALAMGYSDAEIAKLDARLENLIGKDKLQQILQGSGAAAVANADLVDTQLDREIERLRNLRQAN
jgi:hypothetical protein